MLKKELLLLFLILLSLISLVSSEVTSPLCSSPDLKFPPEFLAQMESKIASAGYILQKAHWDWASTYGEHFLSKDCSEDEVVGCHFDNPASPYAFLSMPPSPNEDVDANRKFFLEHDGIESFTDLEGAQRRLRSDELILIFGCTPPPVKFFSFQHYMMDHWNRYRQAFDHIAGSAGKSLNLMTLETETGEPFKSPFAIVMTLDQDRLEEVQSVLKTFLPQGYNNTLRLPERLYPTEKERLLRDTVLTYGVQPAADIFGMALRIAFPFTEEGVEWAGKPLPFHSYRLTPIQQRETKRPFPAPNVVPPDTKNQNEFWLHPAVEFLHEKILHSAQETFGRGGNLTTYETIWTIGRSDPWVPEWAGSCVNGIFGFPWYGAVSHSNCQIDTRDTTYMVPVPCFKMDKPGDFIYIFGVDHTLSNMSTYSNFAFYNWWIRTSILQVQDHEARGSAGKFLKGTKYEDVAPLLIAFRVAREGECLPEETHCFEIPMSETHWKKRPPASWMGFMERAYLNRRTKESSDDRTMIHPWYILFRHNVTDYKAFKKDQASIQVPGAYWYYHVKRLGFHLFGYQAILDYGWGRIVTLVLSPIWLLILLSGFGSCFCCCRLCRRKSKKKVHKE